MATAVAEAPVKTTGPLSRPLPGPASPGESGLSATQPSSSPFTSAAGAATPALPLRHPQLPVGAVAERPRMSRFAVVVRVEVLALALVGRHP